MRNPNRGSPLNSSIDIDKNTIFFTKYISLEGVCVKMIIQRITNYYMRMGRDIFFFFFWGVSQGGLIAGLQRVITQRGGLYCKV